MNRRWVVRRATAAALVAGVIALTGCGADEPESEQPVAEQPAAEQDEALAAMVPDDLREAGVIQTGSSFSAKPVYFKDDNDQPAGALIEIILGAHERLGLETEWKEMPWTALLVGLESNQIDVTGAQETRTEDSASEAIFIGTYSNTSSMLVRKGTEVEEPLDVCGLTVGIPGGSSLNVAWIENVDAECQAQGKDAVEIKEYDAYTDQLVALRASTIDALINATPQQVDTVSALDDLEIKLQGEIRSYVSGFAVSNDDMALAEAYQAAITEMMEDGSYQAALEKYGLESLAVDEVTINPPFEEPILPFD